MVTATRRTLLAAMLGVTWPIASARAEAPLAETMIEVGFTFAGTPLETVAERLTPPIENNLGAANGLGFMVSWSRTGQVQLVLKFKPGVGESAALASVRRQIAQALAQLPPANGEPMVRAVPPERQPIAYVAFIGDRFSLGDITRIVEPQVRERLQTAVGVEGIRVYGSRREIGRVRLDRDRLAAYGLSIEAVRAALAQNGIEASPAPDGDAPGLTLRNRFEPESVGQIVVKTVNGVPVRLRDIAQIERGLRMMASSSATTAASLSCLKWRSGRSSAWPRRRARWPRRCRIHSSSCPAVYPIKRAFPAKDAPPPRDVNAA